jgi:cation diffusion facilitator CzcD-associated flavoprotein CzcO
MVKAKTVAVVGAGSSGIVAAKVLIEDGFDVTLFDREKQIGGIWSPDGAYIDLQAQLVAGFMEFSDLTDKEGISSFIYFFNIHINCI